MEKLKRKQVWDGDDEILVTPHTETATLGLIDQLDLESWRDDNIFVNTDGSITVVELCPAPTYDEEDRTFYRTTSDAKSFDVYQMIRSDVSIDGGCAHTTTVLIICIAIDVDADTANRIMLHRK